MGTQKSVGSYVGGRERGAISTHPVRTAADVSKASNMFATDDHPEEDPEAYSGMKHSILAALRSISQVCQDRIRSNVDCFLSLESIYRTCQPSTFLRHAPGYKV